MATTQLKPHYLDASAAVKLVVREDGSDILRPYFQKHSNFYMTSLCVAETLGVLKVKHLYRKELTQEQYLGAAYVFSCYLNADIHVEDVKIADRINFLEALDYAKKHGLDFSDAFQLLTLIKGPMAAFVGGSRSLLITGDSGLADAARSEGLSVWNCISEPCPTSQGV